MMITCAPLSAAVTFVAGLLVGYCIGGATASRTPFNAVQVPTEKKLPRRRPVVAAQRQATSEPTTSPRRESLAAVRERVARETVAKLESQSDVFSGTQSESVFQRQQQEFDVDVDKALRSAVGPPTTNQQRER